jgi:hypothetical protein
MNESFKKWVFSLALILPMLVFYAGYFWNHDQSLTPTGFIIYDNVSYVAYAKQYIDHDKLSLFYSNPLNDSGNYPAIYFQTQTILLALLLWIGCAPGFSIILLNLIGTLLSFRMVIAIYDHLYPSANHRKLFISFFCWGGGLLALAGVPIALNKSMGNLDFLDRIFFIDPAWGWWGLNLGRGHFPSVEGYYHFLFLAGIFCIIKKKWSLALLVTSILSLSHPFTGIEFLSIVIVWSVAEKLVMRNSIVPWSFIIGIAAILAFHIFYYLFYLNQFPEHRSVGEQYALNWRLRFFSMIPAYCIVGTLALTGLYKWKKEFFKLYSTRLFFCWFIIAFALANHEIFMKPMQPLHFTRGYIWTALFLISLPTLHYLFENRRLKKFGFTFLFSALLFSDNFLWILNSVRFTATSPSAGYITSEQKELLHIIKMYSTEATLIIGKDEILPYLSTVHSKAYPWISHPFTTPFAVKKQTAYYEFLKNKLIDSSWRNREIIFIFRKDNSEELSRSQSMPFPNQVLANTPTYILQKAIIPATVY